MPTSIDSNAGPILSPLTIFIFFPLLYVCMCVWRTPSDIPLSPIEARTPAVGLQNRYEPRTFSKPCRHRSVSGLGGRVRRVVREPGVN